MRDLTEAPEDSPADFGTELRALRQELQLHQWQVAATLTAAQGRPPVERVQHWEHNRRRPRRREAVLAILAGCYAINPAVVTPARAERLLRSYQPQQPLSRADYSRIFGVPAVAPPVGAFGLPPPPRGPSRPPLFRPSGNLPFLPTSFVNRVAELHQLVELLATQRLITLTGPGGIGKTRLAVVVAESVEAFYPDGVFLVDLGPLTEAAAVEGAVAGALGIEKGTNEGPSASLVTALQPYTLLLVLDNCEHLLEGVVPLAEALLANCPHIALLATSREALGIPGELVQRVPPLALPASAPAADVPAADAVQLFVDRARAARPGFTLTPANGDAVARICRRLGGLPLAIELAATRMGAITANELDSHLEGQFCPLGGGPRSAPPRQRTLQTLFDWSYDLLTPAERTLFMRGAIFVGGWTLEAAVAICSDETVPEALVLDLLVQLVAKSLVQATPRPGVATRYYLLEPLRAYAGARLAQTGEMERLRLRYQEWYLALAAHAAAGLAGAERLYWLQRLRAEEENLEAVLTEYRV